MLMMIVMILMVMILILIISLASGLWFLVDDDNGNGCSALIRTSDSQVKEACSKSFEAVASHAEVHPVV